MLNDDQYAVLQNKMYQLQADLNMLPVCDVSDIPINYANRVHYLESDLARVKMLLQEQSLATAY